MLVALYLARLLHATIDIKCLGLGPLAVALALVVVAIMGE